MSAYSVIACDGCAKTVTERSQFWSASWLRKQHDALKGWKRGRTPRIEYKLFEGQPGEQTRSYTIALDFCPDCVARGAHKSKLTLSVEQVARHGHEAPR